MEILEVKNLTFRYSGSDKMVLNDISLKIQKGQIATICGNSGCGKSTFLKLLKKELSPLGEQSGEILFKDKSQNCFEPKMKIGFVSQIPEQQIVTDFVYTELAFGLENLGVNPRIIKRRIAEISNYFGISEWYYKNTSTLSGGQMQILNVASIIVMQPEILILDEPTSQLDPITSSDFFDMLRKINQDFGITIIIAEHNLEKLLSISDRLIVMKEGKVIVNDLPYIGLMQLKNKEDIISLMPDFVQLFINDSKMIKCPLSVCEGKKYIESNWNNDTSLLVHEQINTNSDFAIEMKNVYFRYSRNSDDVLKDANLFVRAGEIYCVLGGNGSGKSTLLSCIAAINKPYSGKIQILGRKLKEYLNNSLYDNCLTLMPQDVQTLFLYSSVRKELDSSKVDVDKLPFKIDRLLDTHPYDLSGGEQQIVALAKVLAANPKILLLDEPTKGIDRASQFKIIKILKSLKSQGVTILIVTHNVEFAANCADRCGMFFDGKIVAEDETNKFFSENIFYTTAINRMTKDYYEDVVTLDDALEIYRLNGGKNITDNE